MLLETKLKERIDINDKYTDFEINKNPLIIIDKNTLEH